MPTEHYDTLGVPPDADTAAIKKAHRAKAMQHHPDRAGDDPQERAAFEKVQRAYLILSDPDKRSRYDKGEDPQAEADNARANIVKLAVRAFMEAVQTGDTALDDMIEGARAALQEQSDTATAALDKLRSERTKWADALERITRDEAVGPNFLAQFITSQIREIDSDDRRIEHRRIEHRRGELVEAIAMLDGFEYRVDEPEPRQWADHRNDTFAYVMQGMIGSGLKTRPIYGYDPAVQSGIFNPPKP